MKVKRVFQNKKKTFHICNKLRENGLDALWIPPVTPGDEKYIPALRGIPPPVRTGDILKRPAMRVTVASVLRHRSQRVANVWKEPAYHS